MNTAVYKIYQGQLVTVEQFGQPVPNRMLNEKGVNLDMSKAYIKGPGFARWVPTSELENNSSTFYWN